MKNGEEFPSTTAPSKMSFSIKQKQTKEAIVKSSFLAEDGINEIDDAKIDPQKRSISYLEDGIIKDQDNFPVRKKEKKEYFIPINNNRRIELLKKILEEGTATEEEYARLQLMIDSLGESKNGSTDESVKGSMTTIGISREYIQDEAVDADYDKIPVGEFGMAFLRGCGWKKEDGIGRGTNKKTVKLIVSEPRPKGLGLGANISQSGKQEGPKDGKRKVLEKNTRVNILSGVDRGLCGQIISMDEDNSSCFVELDSNHRVVRVSQFALEVIGGKL